MRFLVDLCHPGHVHFFRPALARLQAEGHQLLVTARDKDVTVELLRAFAIPQLARFKDLVARTGPADPLTADRRLLADDRFGRPRSQG